MKAVKLVAWSAVLAWLGADIDGAKRSCWRGRRPGGRRSNLPQPERLENAAAPNCRQTSGFLCRDSGRRGRFVLALFLLGVELKGKDQQEDAKHQRVGADPDRQHNGTDQRLDDEQDAEDHRGDAAEREP